MKEAKRVISLILSCILVIQYMPGLAFAAESTKAEEETSVTEEAVEREETAPQVSTATAAVEPVVETVSIQTTPEVDLPDSAELFAGFVERELYDYEITTYGRSARESLNAVEQQLYDYLKEKIEVVALNGGSTVFAVSDISGLKTTWTCTELGVDRIENASPVIDAFIAQFSLDNILDALLNDCPFDMYWFDKSHGIGMGYSITISGHDIWNTATVSDLRVRFEVTEDYSAGEYTVTSDMAKVTTARINAAQVVADNAYQTDVDKLKAYKEYICNAVSYNQEVADSNTTYGDPWQLISVFDDDSDTNVVCEGYAKAFQYLCDLGSLDCISVEGTLDNGSEYGEHMWNVVTLDGKKYLVDVTNCDQGSAGEPDLLFLVGAPYANGGYSFDCGSQTLFFSCSDLALAETNYTGFDQPSEPVPVYTVNVNECQNGTIKADPVTAVAGAIVTLTIKPEEGYELKHLAVKQGTLSVTVVDNQFTMPAGDVTVTAEFMDMNSLTCGDNLTWEFEETTGTLTISGTGKMDNYGYESNSANYIDPPWKEYVDEIKFVTIGTGVTSIGSCAFFECSSLESVTLSDSVESIGKYAFYSCANLTNINIPNGITTIQLATFAHCSKLAEIVIPDTVTKIEGYAFTNTGCTSINVPASVTDISHTAFGAKWSMKGEWGDGVSEELAKISVAQNNPAYSNDEQGALYDKNMTTLFRCPSGYNGVFVVPDSVNTIGEDAFNHCEKITAIYMGKNVTAINEFAFEGITTTCYYPADNSVWTNDMKQNYGGTITWKPYGNPASNLTLLGLDPNTYLGQMIGREDNLVLNIVPSDAIVDMVYAVSDNSILEITDYNNSACWVIAHKPGTVTVTATDKISGVSTTREITIVEPTPITVPFKDEIPITNSFVNRYYSFTPSLTGRYIFSSTACEKPYSDSLNIYIAKGDSGTLAHGWVYPAEDQCQVYADLEAGVTYQVQPQYGGITPGRVAEFTVEYKDTAEPVSSIVLQYDSIVCEWGVEERYYCINAGQIPVGSSKPMTWESSDSSVVEIVRGYDDRCDFIPRKAGEAKITASCGSVSNSVSITVNDPHMLDLDRPISVAQDKGTTQHIFTFTPKESGEYVFSIETDDYFTSGITVSSASSSIPVDIGYGKKSINGYAQLEAGTTYYIGTGSSTSYSFYSDITVSVAKCVGTPNALKLRCVNESNDNLQFVLGAYFTPENTHEKIVKWEISDESILKMYSHTFWASYENTFDVIGQGKVIITATSESGLTASYTYYAGAETDCNDGHYYDENHVCTRCGEIGGTCGKNLVWTLDEKGELKVSGTGAMEDFSSEAPWYSYRNETTAVVIESGVTTIGKNAFVGCNATSITIPEGVVTIGYAAFSGCNMTTITIPQGVTSIGGDAFFDCWALKTITLPQSVTSIGEFAFGNCFLSTVFYRGTEARKNGIVIDDFNENLISADWHYEVTNATYQGQAAYFCGKCDNYYAPDGSKLGSGDGNIHTHTYTSTVTIPNCIGIGYTTHTCECGHVYIDDEVPALGHDYENGICRRCEDVQFVDSGTCGKNLTWALDQEGTLTISGTGEMDNFSGSSNIPWYSYRWDITSVLIEDGVTTIGDHAFGGCGMVSILIPNSVTSIGRCALWNCQSLTSITIPASVTYIHEDQFGGCWKLASIWVNEDNPNFSSDEYGFLFNKNKTTLIRAPLTVTQYKIPGTVTCIGIWAFDHCQNLTEIIISDNVISIGDYAFNGCYNLKSVTIPDGVTNIGYEAFYCCWKLESVTIPASVTSIGVEAFSRCWVLNGIWVSEENPNYSSDEYGVMFNKDKTTLIQAPGAIEQYSIPESVTVIGEAAFHDCFNLTNIVIPNSVVAINRSAFYSCENLGRIVIPNSVTRIGQYAFFDCEDLPSIVIPASVKNIDYLALGDCYSLTSITFEGNAPKFNSRIFRDVTATAYYPEHNDTWTEDTMQQYGGTITWVAYDPCKDGHTESIDAAVSPTCIETGLTEGKHCSVCGEVLTAQVVVPAKGHNEAAVVTAPTCTSDGYTIYTCEDCGLKTIADRVVATGHNWGDWEQITAPTCTKDGTKEQHCSSCTFVRGEKIPATGHSYEVIITKATCTNGGYTTYTCTVCDDNYISDHVEALGHTQETIPGKDPSCTDTGLTEGKHCSVCNEVLVEQEVVPALGHAPAEAVRENEIPATCYKTGSYESVVYCSVAECMQEISRNTITIRIDKDNHDGNVEQIAALVPTCTEAGWEAYECCTKCDYTTYQEIEATGHNEVIDVAVAPTCTETGLTEGKHCGVCCVVLVDQVVIDALGHDYEGVVTTDPTCSKVGEKTYICKNNANHIYTEEVEPLGHTEAIDEAVVPTCTETGLTEGKHCDVCGEVLVQQEVMDAQGHAYKDGTCSVCGEKDPNYVKPSKPAWDNMWDWIFGGWWGNQEKCDHSYTSVVTAPTCTDKGYTTHTCSKCGDSYQDSQTNALGHAWDDGVVTKEPTCTKDGVKTYTCETCGQQKTETIMATGHDYEDGICGGCGAVEPTKPSEPTEPENPNKPSWGNMWDWIFGGWWK